MSVPELLAALTVGSGFAVLLVGMFTRHVSATLWGSLVMLAGMVGTILIGGR